MLALKEVSRELLLALSHPLRRDIIKSIEGGPTPYSTAMVSCGLDPNHDSGLFSYHLNALTRSKIVQRRGGRYGLTDLGRRSLEIARSAEALGEDQGRSMGGRDARGRSRRRRNVDRAKVVEVDRVERATIEVRMEDCMVLEGEVYWGLTKKTIGVDEVTCLWRLKDGSIVFEVRDPESGENDFAMHHLREDGLHTLGGVIEIEREGQRALETYNEAWMGRTMRVYPLPLKVGRSWKYESGILQTSTRPEITGWESREGTTTYEGEVLGQYRVTIDSRRFECLLLREIVVSGGVTIHGDGDGEVEETSLRVLMDRYLNPNGRLRLEYLWYTRDGGERSMTRDEARNKAGPNFEEIGYGGETWYRVIRVPLDEPRPAEAKRFLRG